MIKRLFGTAFIGAMLLGTSAMAQNGNTTELPLTPAPTKEITEVDVYLKGYLFGLRIAKVKFKSGYSDDEYYALASMKTSGLGALVKKWAIWAISTGSIVDRDIKPASHLQQNLNKKHRRVEMSYGKDKVNVEINPPLYSQGTPPASPKERFNSDDTLSVLVNLAMGGFKTSEKVCDSTVPVFDSKQHYKLRLERGGEKYIKQKGFEGDTIICKVYYIPVSGFDADDLPTEEEEATPLYIYLSKNDEAGVYIPVKMTYKVSGFKAVIKTRDIKIRKRIVDDLEFKGLGFDEQEDHLNLIGFLAK